MYIRQDRLGAPSPGDTLPYVEALEATEKGQREEMERHCKGVNVLEWLERNGPRSLREYIAQLERRLAATPRLVEGHQKLRRLLDDLSRELRAGRRPPPGFRDSIRAIFIDYPELQLFPFPAGYRIQSVNEEVAQVRCKLSRARLNFLIWNRTGRPPKGAGFIRLGEPPSPAERILTRAFDKQTTNRPLSLWTIIGFRPKDAALSRAQLSEIDLIAGGIARNPRTRSGMPVLTIRGGFTRGENANVGNSRAAAVREALKIALQRMDPNLIMSVGLDLAQTVETSQPEVSISMRELIAPQPQLRISPDSPLVQPPTPLAPTGTPLPPGPPAAPSRGRSVHDQFRSRVDSVLRKFGVKNPAVREAIANSAVFQTEEALRAAVAQAGVSSDVQRAIVESIRALSRERPR